MRIGYGRNMGLIKVGKFRNLDRGSAMCNDVLGGSVLLRMLGRWFKVELKWFKASSERCKYFYFKLSRDERLNADNVKGSFRLQFFSYALSREREIKSSKDKVGWLFGGKDANKEVIIVSHNYSLSHRVV